MIKIHTYPFLQSIHAGGRKHSAYIVMQVSYRNIKLASAVWMPSLPEGQKISKLTIAKNLPILLWNLEEDKESVMPRKGIAQKIASRKGKPKYPRWLWRILKYLNRI
jgi:hypothetical protein